MKAEPASPVAAAARAEPVPPVVARACGLENRSEREAFTLALFNQTAGAYDHSNNVAFLRRGRSYRRQMLLLNGLRAGCAHLDVGSGTGLCAELSQEIVGETGRVVALDPSPAMLEFARQRGVREIVVGRAEHLPFPDASFDLVSMCYMLRHVDDMHTAFSEARRVLRPGGKIMILEVTPPTSVLVRAGFRLATHWIVPSLSVVKSRKLSTFKMMRYWAQTIDSLVSPERIVGALERCGLMGARHVCELGVFSCYRGVVPADTK